ncbi:MAG: ATP-binding protein [bacterium]
MRQLKSMTLHDWRQFKRLELDFDAPVTFLTGANASGKTTVLRVINLLVGWSHEFSAIHSFNQNEEGKYIPDTFTGVDKGSPDNRHRSVGTVVFSNSNFNNEKQSLRIHYNQEKSGYHLSRHFDNPTIELHALDSKIYGFYLPAGRQIARRFRSKPLSAEFKGFNSLKAELDSLYEELEATGSSSELPYGTIKQALMQVNLFSNANVLDANEFEYAIENFNRLLREILPDEINFNSLLFYSSDIELSCGNGMRFSIDEVSGGVSSLLNLVWQLFVCSMINMDCLVLIDEPENHLHPKLQRTLFPKLIKAFPTFQFVAATHSPVILGSVQDANVYALKFNDEGLVESLDVSDKLKSPATADDMLQEILGVEVLEPQWVAAAIDELVKDFESKELSEKSLDELRSKMMSMGMEHSFVRTLHEIDKLKRK